jgi:hypothetical protein
MRIQRQIRQLGAGAVGSLKKVFCLLISMLPELNRGILQRCGRRLQYLKKKILFFLSSLEGRG